MKRFALTLASAAALVLSVGTYQERQTVTGFQTAQGRTTFIECPKGKQWNQRTRTCEAR